MSDGKWTIRIPRELLDYQESLKSQWPSQIGQVNIEPLLHKAYGIEAVIALVAAYGLWNVMVVAAKAYIEAFMGEAGRIHARRLLDDNQKPFVQLAKWLWNAIQRAGKSIKLELVINIPNDNFGAVLTTPCKETIEKQTLDLARFVALSSAISKSISGIVEEYRAVCGG